VDGFAAWTTTKSGLFCFKRWAMGLIPAYMQRRHQKGFIALAREAYKGKENKSGHANENQNPLENACME
jgi:hypothetical protein